MGDLGIYRDTAQLDHDVADLLWDNVAHELIGHTASTRGLIETTGTVRRSTSKTRKGSLLPYWQTVGIHGTKAA